MKVIIAGGGIGGMSAALALLKKGIDVEVYEQAAELKEVGAGIQISPNGCRALDELGVFQTLKGLSCDPVRKEFRLWNTGKAWTLFDLGKNAIEKYGYPYLTVYRPDLLDTLINAVRDLKPDAIHLGARAAGLEQDETRATLVLEDGRKITGDVLIGADGWRSVIRNTLWGECNPHFSGMVTWRGLIPMKDLPAHMQVHVGSTWIGPGAHVVSYPLHRGAIMNFVATIENKTWSSQAGCEPGTTEECLDDFKGWHEDVQTMIRLCPSLLKWALMKREPIERWSLGRVSLVGDACHATLPFLAQGAVHSIEDGVVLARCLEADKSLPAAALSRFEKARIERTSRMVRGATSNTGRFHSEELATEESAEKYLAREWSSDPIADRYDWLYSYDAAKAPI